MSRPTDESTNRKRNGDGRAAPSHAGSPGRKGAASSHAVTPADETLGIVREEEQLCHHVVEHLQTVRPSRPPPRFDDDATLISLRDQIATARLEDVPSLMAQMEQVSAVATQRSQQTAEPVDRQSPYFGHLRLRERDRGTRDVLIGKTTYLEPRANIRIVDWRHAPISQLYYRYEEGARYEEIFGEREVEGQILVRRTVTINDGKLERVSAPQGTFVRTTAGTWRSHGEDLSYDEITRLAAEARPFLAVIDPDADLFFHPGDMPGKICKFCAESGQPVPQSKGEIVRVSLESLALNRDFGRLAAIRRAVR